MILEKVSKAIGEGLGFELNFEFSKAYGDVSVSPSELIRASKDNSLSVIDLVAKLDDVASTALGDIVEKTEYINGFFNVYLSDQIIVSELSKILENVGSYVINTDAKSKVAVFDYSSPNIAKPFSVGHLRSTIIGQANLNCHKAVGYETVGINHIGDWGTQFGKLIVAIKKWGDEEKIAQDPIAKLNQLYVKFHSEAENDPKLNDEARQWFLKLEKNDEEARRLWEKCVAWSFTEFDELYKKLGVKIDHVIGESFYENMLDEVVTELKEKKLLKESEGALIVDLDDLPPALIKKTDGATLYLTRDLAALKYRIEKYKPHKVVYHVGNDQALHFRQLEEVAEKLGWLNDIEVVFAGHGLLRLAEGKMSTRQGRVVLLGSLIDEAIKRSVAIIDSKNPGLKNKREVARKIGVSAIKYSDLYQNRKSDIIFSMDKAITMDGNSGPYIQYSYARMTSLIGKFKSQYEAEPIAALDGESEGLGKLLLMTPGVLLNATSSSNPSLVCEHAYKISNLFNRYYEKEKIVTDSEESTREKIFAVFVAREVLGILLDILGIDRLDEI